MKSPAPTIFPRFLRLRLQASLPPVLAILCAFTVLFYIWQPFYGVLLLAALAGLGLFLLAWRWPISLVIALVLVAPFNYGKPFAGAVIKISELIIIAMLAVAVGRMAAGDREVWARLRRARWLMGALGLLGMFAAATAVPHPNFFNVRYEIFNYIALLYALLFFRVRHWPLLLAAFTSMMLVEALAALALKFVFGLTGWVFFGEGGGLGIQRFTSEDITAFAGGRYRISGTMGHKNMLAAFYILLLPAVGLEMLRRPRPLWLAVSIPALIVMALSDSMTGWGALLLVVTLALFHLRRFDYLAVLILLVLPLAALGLLKFGESVFFRIQQLLYSYEGLNTVRSRLTMLDISRHLVATHPWFGIGRNNFMAYGETYYGHAHNLFLMKIIEMGIPAGAAFGILMLGLIGRIWIAILREPRRLAAQNQYYRTLGLWLGCAGFLAMNLFDYNYAHFSLGPLFMALLGIGLAIAWNLEDPQTPGGPPGGRSPAFAAREPRS